MPINKLKPEMMEPDALVGRAAPVSDFNTVAVHKLNEVIDQLNNATPVGEPYVDLRQAAYNVVANDPTKVTSNRTGVQAPDNNQSVRLCVPERNLKTARGRLHPARSGRSPCLASARTDGLTGRRSRWWRWLR
jgi:hypothetical protein